MHVLLEAKKKLFLLCVEELDVKMNTTLISVWCMYCVTMFASISAHFAPLSIFNKHFHFPRPLQCYSCYICPPDGLDPRSCHSHLSCDHLIPLTWAEHLYYLSAIFYIKVAKTPGFKVSLQTIIIGIPHAVYALIWSLFKWHTCFSYHFCGEISLEVVILTLLLTQPKAFCSLLQFGHCMHRSCPDTELDDLMYASKVAV